MREARRPDQRDAPRTRRRSTARSRRRSRSSGAARAAEASPPHRPRPSLPMPYSRAGCRSSSRGTGSPGMGSPRVRRRRPGSRKRTVLLNECASPVGWLNASEYAGSNPPSTSARYSPLAAARWPRTVNSSSGPACHALSSVANSRRPSPIRLARDRIEDPDAERRNALAFVVLVLVVAPDQHEIGCERVELGAHAPVAREQTPFVPFAGCRALVGAPLRAHRFGPGSLVVEHRLRDAADLHVALEHSRPILAGDERTRIVAQPDPEDLTHGRHPPSRLWDTTARPRRSTAASRSRTR